MMRKIKKSGDTKRFAQYTKDRNQKAEVIKTCVHPGIKKNYLTVSTAENNPYHTR